MAGANRARRERFLSRFPTRRLGELQSRQCLFLRLRSLRLKRNRVLRRILTFCNRFGREIGLKVFPVSETGSYVNTDDSQASSCALRSLVTDPKSFLVLIIAVARRAVIGTSPTAFGFEVALLRSSTLLSSSALLLPSHARLGESGYVLARFLHRCVNFTALAREATRCLADASGANQQNGSRRKRPFLTLDFLTQRTPMFARTSFQTRTPVALHQARPLPKPSPFDPTGPPKKETSVG